MSLGEIGIALIALRPGCSPSVCSTHWLIVSI